MPNAKRRIAALWRPLAIALALGAPLAGAAHAQRAVTVSGYVIAKGVPVRGARVSVPALGVGATSDDEGRYSFIISASQVHGQTVTITARHRRYDTRSAPINVVGGALRLDFDLEPLGTRTNVEKDPAPAIPAGVANAATSAAAVRPAARGDIVDGGTLLESAGQGSLARELSGRVPGLVVTAATTQSGSARLTLRGPHSLYNGDQPLFVVDGLPVDNSSFAADAQRAGIGGFDYGSSEHDLNPADVESIRILKGPGAAVLFGSRATNGVVLVTTRNGGDLNGFAVSASQQLTFESPLRLSKFQNAYGQGLGGQFEFVNGRGAGINDSVAQSWGPALDSRPLAQFSETEAAHPDVRFWQAHPDNVRKFFEMGRSLTTNVAVQGSGDRGNGRLSLSNQDVGGVVPNSYFSRKTAAIDLARTFTEQFRVSVNAQGMTSRGLNRPGTGDDGANPMIGLVQMGRQVDIAALKAHRLDASGTQISWNYAGQNNPYFGAFENGNADSRRRLIGQGSATYDLTQWLSATTRVGTDVYRSSRDFRVASGWMGGYLDYAGRGDFSNGGLQNQDIHAQQTNADVLLRAQVRQDREVRFGVTVGGNQSRDDDRIETIATDALLTPGVYNISNSATITLPSSTSTAVRTSAAYAALDIGVRDVASITIGERAERSSALAKDHDSYVNSSVSGTVAFTRLAPALHLGGLITDGGLHAQWARASDASFTLGELSLPVTSFGGVPRATVPDALSNPSLLPETTNAWEIGTSLQAPHGIGLDITYYNEARSNQIVVLDLPISSGFSKTVVNGGEVTNRGLEAQISAPIFRSSSGLAWEIAAGYASNTNQVRSLYNGLSSIALGPKLFGVSIEARAGYPLSVLVGHRFLRDAATGQLLLRDGHPLPDTVAGNQVLGNTLPKGTASIANTIRYKALELRLLFEMRRGAKIFSATNLLGSYSGTLAETAFRPDTGLLLQGIDIATGKANTTHVTTENYFHSLLPIQERWVYDASFTKLREARLSFTLPPRLPLLSGGNARISVIGRNLLMWTRAPNIDPESALSTSTFLGAELGQLPGVRSVGLQLSITP
jgi:TonB-dependent SusC/RagA subfamily outer membrane receptor